jgi:hypothetical protein
VKRENRQEENEMRQREEPLGSNAALATRLSLSSVPSETIGRKITK